MGREGNVPAIGGPPPRGRGRWLVFCLGLFAVVSAVRALGTVTADPDLFGYLQFGKHFWTTGKFPFTDYGAAYTPVRSRWVYHEWLTGILFYPLQALFGWSALQILKWAVGMATFILLFRIAARNNASRTVVLAAGILLLVVMGVAYSPVRAQVFTYFFFAVILKCCVAWEQGKITATNIFLPLLFPLWAGLHGGVLAGLGILGLFSFGAFLRAPSEKGIWLPPMLVLVSGVLLITLFNPYGLDYWSYLIRAVGMERRFIGEWAPLGKWSRGDLQGRVILASATLISLGALAGLIRGVRKNLPFLIVTGACVFLGFRHARHLPFLAMSAYVAIALTARRVCLRAERILLVKRRFRGVWGTILLLLSVGVFRGTARHLSWRIETKGNGAGIVYPIAALEVLEGRGEGGNVAAWFGWGEYITWKTRGRWKVAFDGRYETVYSPATAKMAFDFYYAGEGWRRLLENYPTDAVLLPSRLPVVQKIRRLPKWRVLYEDEKSILLAREKL